MTTSRVAAPRAPVVATPAPVLAAVAGLTALALVLRASALEDGLFGDELYTFEVARQSSLGDVFSAIDRTENNPPLLYLLAWGAAKLGDPTVWIRVPSLVFSTATVPVIYLLGRRVADQRAGVLAAAVFALSPFAVFFGSEARAYALLMFLVALSTLLLLVASERDQARWWAAYAVCAVLAVYAHYTGVLVLAAQAAWAVWARGGRRRALIPVYGAIALACLAWFPAFLAQDTPPLAGFKLLGAPPFSSETVARELVVWLVGHPFLPPADVPGRIALVLLGLAAAVALAGTVGRVTRPSAPVLLVCLVAVAAPLGAAVYSVFGTDIFYARNLNASLPGLCVAIGALLASLRRPFFEIAATLVAAGLLAGLVHALDDDNGRPPFRAAAEFVDANARPGDPVIQFTFTSLADPLGRILPVHFDDHHDLFAAGDDERRAWARGERGAHVFMVIPQVGDLAGVPRRAGPGNRFVLRSHEIYAGFTPVGVFEYSRADSATARPESRMARSAAP